MADFIYKGVLGGSEPEERTFDVVAGGTATIAIGDIVAIANGYAAKVADGGMAAGNGLYGLAISDSDETATAAGTVKVQYSPCGLVVQGTATTPGNLAAGVLFDKVTIDVDGSGNQTVDENDAGAALIYSFVGATYATTGLVKVVLPFTLAS